jgi:uncharacterized protein YbjT (DUF2867 family)
VEGPSSANLPLMKILLFGASGLAGGGLLRRALAAADVTEVRALTRRPLPEHPKLRSIRHDDYLDYSAVADSFDGLDACFYCLGISTTQAESEPHYRRITQEFAVTAAAKLAERSPNAAFHYLSGDGADLQSRQMWARVKADAERELQANHSAVCYRPAAIGGPASPSGPWVYHLVRPFFPLMRPFRDLYVECEDLGRAMLEVARQGTRGTTHTNRQIRQLADQARSRERAQR